MARKLNIALIDTAVLIDHPSLKGYSICHSPLFCQKELEHIGHGTAVCEILLRHCPEADVTVFPVFSYPEYAADVASILAALECILNSDQHFDLINMSMGITHFEDIVLLGELHDVCISLYKKGVIIVAGYDNNGSMSYPACFDEVIGVDSTLLVTKHSDFIYVENSPINIRGSARPQRVSWDNPSFMLCTGSSFVVPYISGLITNMLSQKSSCSEMPFYDALNVLKDKASSCVICDVQDENYSLTPPNVHKAIVLPVNKEIHSLMRFADIASFEIVGFFDIKQKGLIGKTFNQVVNSSHTNSLSCSVIGNIESIDWAGDFDTVIIGHMKEICDAIGNDSLRKTIDNAIVHGKQIICYDAFSQKFIGDNFSPYILPNITKNDVPVNQFGKMWNTSTPILAVFGTRSRQGKFTSQIWLKQKFESIGYRVGYLSSEVTGRFLGADYILPYGYESAVTLEGEDFVMVTNKLMHNIDVKAYDLIITGGQSGVLPYDPVHRSRLLIPQHLFLLGVYPDVVILCVSYDDEDEYIERTIAYIEAFSGAHVAALLMYPIVSEVFLFSSKRMKDISSTEEFTQRLAQLHDKFGIPIYLMDIHGVDNAANDIIAYLSGEV